MHLFKITLFNSFIICNKFQINKWRKKIEDYNLGRSLAIEFTKQEKEGITEILTEQHQLIKRDNEKIVEFAKRMEKIQAHHMSVIFVSNLCMKYALKIIIIIKFVSYLVCLKFRRQQANDNI